MCNDYTYGAQYEYELQWGRDCMHLMARKKRALEQLKIVQDRLAAIEEEMKELDKLNTWAIPREE